MPQKISMNDGYASNSLRILLGPWNRSIEWIEQIDNADIIVFGEGMPLQYQFHKDSMSDLLARLPNGWEPDALVFWQPHLYAMPTGWEKSEIPVFGIIGPWQLLGLLDCDLDWLRTIEGIFVDAAGVEYFMRHGFENVWPFLSCSFDPALHYPDPALEKIYDISFAGALVHPIHRQRTAWLYRVAKMADRYKIGFFDWVLGPEQYAQLLRQSRIVFNHSYRGELNIRSFEAMASGALLFLEDTNFDVKDHFEEGIHYISYNRSNYRERLDYYLTNDDERERIAENGRRQVQLHTNGAHISWLTDKLRSILTKPCRNFPQIWTPRHKGINHFVDFYSPMTSDRAHAIRRAWAEAKNDGDDPAWVEAALAAVDFRLAKSQPAEKRSKQIGAARYHLEQSISIKPDWAWPRYGLGHLLYTSGQEDLALEVLNETTKILQSIPAKAVSDFGPYIPYDYDHFMVDWLENNIRIRDNGGDRAAVWATLLEARCHEIMGKIHLERSDSALAQISFTRAVELRPDIGHLHLLLAKAAAQQKHYKKALVAVQKSIEIDAINVQAWILASQLLLKTGQYEACAAFCEERLTALKALPNLQKTVVPLQSILAKALEISTPEADLSGPIIKPSTPSKYYQFSRPEVQALVPKSARRILDIGCAAGELGRALKDRQDCEVTGIEINPKIAEMARSVIDTVYTEDVTQLAPSLLKNHFDCIILADVLEHLLDPTKTLRALVPRLAKNGRFVISIPNVRHWSVIRGLLEGHWDYEKAGILDQTHLKFFTRTSFEKLLGEVGLRPVSVNAISINSEPIPTSVIDSLRAAGLNVNTLAEESKVYQFLYAVQPAFGPSLESLTSIIILTHNQLEYTKKCIESILKETKEPFELIVVDNSSTDGTDMYLEKLVHIYEIETDGSKQNTKAVTQHRKKKRKKKPKNAKLLNGACRGVRLIKNDKNLGFAAGNNQGMAVAKGHYILLMNNDVVVTPGWLKRMISCAERSPKIGIVGPMSNYVSGPQLVKEVSYDTTSLARLNKFSREFAEKNTDQGKLIWRVVGFCMLIKRVVIDKIGGMDERYGLGNFEDDDFSLRAALAGFESRIAEDCFVHHFGSRTFIGAKIDYRESLSEKWEIFKKKWAMPQELPYGSSYDFSQIAKEGFIKEKHYFPLTEKDSSTVEEKASSFYLPEPGKEYDSKVKLKSIDKTITASIIVPVSKGQEHLRKCIENIQEHTPDPYELIFAKNGFKSSTIKWLKQYVKENPRYQLVACEKDDNIAKCYNEGIKASSGEYIVLLHSDVLVSEGWLPGMLECIKNNPDAGIVGPLTNNTIGVQKVADADSASIDHLQNYAKTFREKYRYRHVQSRILNNFCMLFRRDLVEKIGLLDESLGYGQIESEDFCLRATIEGYKNLIAADVFIYKHNGKSQSISRKAFNEKWSGISSRSSLGKKLLASKALEKAVELDEKDQIDNAVKMLLEGMGHAPKDKKLNYAIAEMLIKNKQFKDAFDTLNEMSLDDQDVMKLTLIGYCMEGMERYDEAEEYADRALSLDPASALALNLKGTLAFGKGDKATAEDFFKRAIDSDPGYGEPYTNLGTLKWDKEGEEAFSLYEKGFILSPNTMDTVTIYHSAVTNLGKSERAEPIFRDASVLHPNNRRLKFLLIDILVQLGKHDLAMKEIENAMITFGIDDGLLSAALQVRETLGSKEIEKSSKKKDTISLCMIVKNEEQHLAKCLMSVKPVVDEMIVVDTGSTDRTIDIARAFGARIYDFKWTNDFSEARNYSISKASGAWIFVLDADEVISSIDYDSLRKIVKKPRTESSAYYFVTRNYTALTNTAGWVSNDDRYTGEQAGTGWYPSKKVRLFPSDSRIRFENHVHELVEPSLRRSSIKIMECSIPVHHYGKLSIDKVVSKGQEYYILGKTKLEGKTDDVKSLTELAIQALELGKYEEALEFWQRVIEIKPDNTKALLNMGGIYLELGRYEDALRTSRKAMALGSHLKEVVLNYSSSELFIGDIEKSVSSLENLVRNEPEYPPAIAMLSTAYFILGEKEKGLKYIDKIKKMGFNLSNYLYIRAKQFISAGKTDYAILLLEIATESNNANRDVISLLFECYRKYGTVAGNVAIQSKNPEPMSSPEIRQ